MKKQILFSVATMTLITTSAFSDQMPPEWHLPNKGKDCFFSSSFERGHACGESRYEVWDCRQPQDPSKKTTYLLVGEIQSDVANSCSPTFVVKQVIKGSRFTAQ